MTSTLRFSKYLGRYGKTDNRIINQTHSKSLGKALNIQTYHQLQGLRSSRDIAVNGVKSLTGLQNTLTFGKSFSSVINEAKGSEFIVRHDPVEQKFYVDVEVVGSAFIEYERKDDSIILKHTEVPDKLGGRGIGKILAKKALEYVAKHDLQLEIQCSFICEYVSKYEPKYIIYLQK